ncbi:MAG: radical SAM protein [Candidatus Tectomicrobia bacterium]|nr:radical SAM protein [Candidatus Tectomicrobia bacterium]
MHVVILNPPNVDEHTYIARSADRWPHRVAKGRLFRNTLFPKYPLYLTYAAALLEQHGFEVSIIDAAERNYSHAETVERIARLSPRLVVTEIAEPSRLTDLQTVAALRAATGAHQTLIGPHATAFAMPLVQESAAIDSICRGEYYETLLDLACTLDRAAPLAAVRGLTYRQDGQPRSTPDRPLLKEIDKLPWPARHLLDPHRYLMGHYTYKPQLLMMTSIGCPYQCIFCIWPKVLYDSGKVRYRHADDVAAEVEEVVQRWGAREIYFDDDCFNLSERRVLEVCDAILRRGVIVPWITEMRCDRVSERMLERMRAAGCIKILYGVESGNQEILDNAKKGITLEQVRRTFKLTRQAGIRTHATFMLGLPGETPQTIEATISFAKELEPDTIQCSIALPYTGTEFYDLARANGTLKVDSWLDFDGELCGAVEYAGLSKEYIRGSVNRFYRTFYLRPGHLGRRILSIRTWSDIERFWHFAKGYLRRFS